MPVLGKFLGLLQAFLLGADAAIAAGEVGRRLSIAAVRPFVDMNFAAENRVSRYGAVPRPKMCKLCEDCETATDPERPVKIFRKLLF